jgi:hypothetical protein
MVTLGLILLLLLVPASRRILLRMVFSVLGTIGIISAVTRNPPPRRKL